MNKLRKILLINPPYEPHGIKESVSSTSVTLSLAMLAAVAKKLNRDVRILDLNLSSDYRTSLVDAVNDFIPELVGITFATPLLKISDNIALIIKELLGRNVLVVGGGPHTTARPKETLAETCFDAVAIGEAELSFEQLLSNCSFEGGSGWVYRGGEGYYISGPTQLVEDIDALPFGAFELFQAEKYIYPKESSRENPVCLIETSRGCYGRCTFCNKNIFGYRIRLKSAKRVVDEFEYILSQGFKEIHMADDSFTADINHAKGVCHEIIRRGLKFPWVPRSGIRVDRVTEELLEVMKKAGCYHIPFGIESGNQAILDSIKKGITIKQIREAVSVAKSVGMETTGYFMFGLPGETIDTIKQTIDFALELNLDHIKFGATIPLPGTLLFDSWYQEGRIKTLDWEKYTYSTPPWKIYDHPTLRQKDLENITILGKRLLDVANVGLHFNQSQ